MGYDANLPLPGDLLLYLLFLLLFLQKFLPGQQQLAWVQLSLYKHMEISRISIKAPATPVLVMVHLCRQTHSQKPRCQLHCHGSAEGLTHSYQSIDLLRQAIPF